MATTVTTVKKTCTHCDSPNLGLGLVRIAVGVFFLAFGLMKLMVMGPAAVQKMLIEPFFNVGSLAPIFTWALILTEIIGGGVLLLGKIFPRSFYKMSVLALILLTVVAFVAVHYGNFSSGVTEKPEFMKKLLWHMQLLLVLGGLFVTAPRCPLGITGHK